MRKLYGLSADAWVETKGYIMKFGLSRRHLLSRAIASASMTVAPLPLTAATTRAAATATELPLCPSYSGLHGAWRARARAGSVELNSSDTKSGSVVWSGTKVSRREAELEFDLKSPAVVISAKIPAKFSSGEKPYEFIKISDGKGRVGYLKSKDKILQPTLKWAVFIEKTVIASGQLDWKEDVSIYKEDVTLKLGEYNLEKIVRIINSKSGMMYFGLIDTTGAILRKNAYLYGLGADSNGFREAVEAGERNRQRAEAMLKANKCKMPSGGCFLTTASCDLFGRPDDCWELETLRGYRDDVLARSPSGREYIQEYYAIAPHILSALPVSGWRRRAVLSKIYFFTVLPCAALVAAGMTGAAFALYRRAVRVLAVRYLAGSPTIAAAPFGRHRPGRRPLGKPAGQQHAGASS